MSAPAIIRFGELRAESFVQGSVNNWLIYSPLPHSKPHSSGIDGDIVIGSTPTVEIVDADLDVAIPDGFVYSYSVATDNKLKIAFSKDLYTSKQTAVEALQCLSITYELGNLQPNGNLYVLIARNSLGEEIHRTTPLPLSQINTVISTFDDTRATDYGGYLEFEVSRDYIVIS